jgi:transposase-like protein
MKIDFWRAYLEKISDTGAAISAYCKEHGLSPASIYYWRRRLEGDSTTHGFDELSVCSEDAELPDFALRLSSLDQRTLCRLVLMFAGQEHA